MLSAVESDACSGDVHVGGGVRVRDGGAHSWLVALRARCAR